MDGKKLLQVKISNACMQQLDDIKKVTGISTLSDVIRFSVVLFKWVVEKQKDGFDIYAIPNSTRKEGNEKQAEKVDLLIPV